MRHHHGGPGHRRAARQNIHQQGDRRAKGRRARHLLQARERGPGRAAAGRVGAAAGQGAADPRVQGRVQGEGAGSKRAGGEEAQLRAEKGHQEAAETRQAARLVRGGPARDQGRKVPTRRHHQERLYQGGARGGPDPHPGPQGRHADRVREAGRGDQRYPLRPTPRRRHVGPLQGPSPRAGLRAAHGRTLLRRPPPGRGALRRPDAVRRVQIRQGRRDGGGGEGEAGAVRAVARGRARGRRGAQETRREAGCPGCREARAARRRGGARARGRERRARSRRRGHVGDPDRRRGRLRDRRGRGRRGAGDARGRGASTGRRLGAAAADAGTGRGEAGAAGAGVGRGGRGGECRPGGSRRRRRVTNRIRSGKPSQFHSCARKSVHSSFFVLAAFLGASRLRSLPLRPVLFRARSRFRAIRARRGGVRAGDAVRHVPVGQVSVCTGVVIAVAPDALRHRTVRLLHLLIVALFVVAPRFGLGLHKLPGNVAVQRALGDLDVGPLPKLLAEGVALVRPPSRGLFPPPVQAVLPERVQGSALPVFVGHVPDEELHRLQGKVHEVRAGDQFAQMLVMPLSVRDERVENLQEMERCQ